MNRLLLKNVKSRLCVIRLVYFISVTDQIDFYQFRNLFFIIHYQDVNF
ncbi:hypothetical protein SDC9_179393 [bioreactor metagenome]|uniref:Uncharacterized protein n=1 Tax=bioreactor metagenome TaxID=1076179 RepID=A0A645GYV8_9ZZZZ